MWPYLVAISAGISTVFQGGLNRAVAEKTSLSFSVFWNTLVFCFAAAIFFAVDQMRSTTEFRLAQWPSKFEWWSLLPGLLGLVIVAGIPLSLGKIGATRVFIIIVLTQLIVALAWDSYIQGTLPDLKQIAGIILAVISVLLIK
jgi:uncharacterized membrane protein YdcZ (DUF606 family)